ncbi:MAG: ABC-type multidrug transport system fused ATPase/permease subunit, partial [Myxococcota bacterium]
MKPIIGGIVALTFGSAMSLAYPLVVQNIIDGIDTGGAALVDRASLILVILFAAGAALGALRSWLFTVAGERVVARLRSDLFRQVIHQEIAFFDERRTGELTNRLASDTTVLQNTVTVNISMLLRFLVMGTGAIAFLFYTSWRLTLVTVVLVPVVAVTAGVIGQRLRRLSRDVQDALAVSTTVAEEAISGARTVRAFAAEDLESERYREAVERSFEVARRRAAVTALFRGALGFAGYATIAVVLWYGGHLLVQKEMTIGELTSYLLYTLTVAFSLGAISGLYEDFMKALGASERVFELLDRVPTLVSGDTTLESTAGAIEFRGVDFAYPSRPDQQVLKDFSLDVSPGEIVALVG